MRRFGVRIPTRSLFEKPVSQRYGLFLCVNISVYSGCRGGKLASQQRVISMEIMGFEEDGGRFDIEDFIE